MILSDEQLSHLTEEDLQELEKRLARVDTMPTSRYRREKARQAITAEFLAEREQAVGEVSETEEDDAKASNTG